MERWDSRSEREEARARLESMRGLRADWEAGRAGWVVEGSANRAAWREGSWRRALRSVVVLSRRVSGSQLGSMGGI